MENVSPERRLILMRAARACMPTIRYWMETEVHVYAFSIAANVLLSLFPFLIVSVSICRYVLRWKAAEAAIYFALSDYFPDSLGDFVVNNLRYTVNARGPAQALSILLLFFTANGIFEPLEVALNRAWGVARNRSYFRNQLLSLLLIFTCGGLFLGSIILTALNRDIWHQLTGISEWAASLLAIVAFNALAVPLSMLTLFLVYWLLPNRRLPWRDMVAPAIFVGLALEALKYINLFTWPWLRAKLEPEYGPFYRSATIILWSFLGAMIVLAGAEWTARRARRANQPPAAPELVNS